MKHIILGTAGHVDHGKTSLVKALTGIDTDRLKEEKERGITIELGFASLALPHGRILGLVDVPGHERFIRNMVAGAGGIDLVVMVIAADEGVMPQTREHLHICSLLGIKKGLIALAKTDLVEETWLELVTDDIREFLKGTFLESAPIVPVSAVTGKGLPELLQAIEEIASQIEADADSGICRLPVDRVFVMKGFGTVVTGTLLSGKLRVGEGLAILPGRWAAKVRGLQVHNRQVEEAEAGQRTAVNLQGVEKALILRGNVLAHPSELGPSRRLDVACEYLAGNGKKLKNRTLVRMHVGTSETMARVIFLDRDELEPGETAYAQLILETPAVVMAKDRFVLRSYSPMTTVGGGVILDPQAVKHKRHADKILHDFYTLHEGSDGERTAVIVERAGLAGITIGQLTARTGIHQEMLKKILAELFSGKQAVLLDKEETRVVASSVYKNIQDRIVKETKGYHEKFPLKEGLRKEELKTTLGPYVGAKLFNMAAKELEKNGLLIIDRENVRLAGHSVDLQGELSELREKIARTYLQAGLMPPTTKEVTAKFADRKSQADTVISVMLKEGVLVKISEDLFFHRDVLQKLRNDYKNLLVREGKGTPAGFKELTGLSRKFVIPLMEYFDMTKLTIRAGEHRLLRDKTLDSDQ
jgi:selenocysteine-specific elongation factor